MSLWSLFVESVSAVYIPNFPKVNRIFVHHKCENCVCWYTRINLPHRSHRAAEESSCFVWKAALNEQTASVCHMGRSPGKAVNAAHLQVGRGDGGGLLACALTSGLLCTNNHKQRK